MGQIDITALSPVQKMDLADVLYDTAQQELEALPLSNEQLREIDRRIATAEAAEEPGESWELVYQRLRHK